jgi:hypothetical protein
MSAADIEAFLARVYVDPAVRSRFRAHPYAEAKSAGLSEEESHSLEHTDWVGLEMAARSFARKRSSQGPRTSFFAKYFGRFFRPRP